MNDELRVKNNELGGKMKYRYRTDEEMKDSGVEWIGKIPKGWSVNRLKNITNIFGRIGFRGYTVEDLVNEGEGAITLSPSNIENQSLVLDKKTYISWSKYEESPEIKIYNGDIVFVKTASVGKAALIEGLNEKATINPQFVVFKNIGCNKKYLYYNTISNVIQQQVNRAVNGGVVGTLTQQDINNYSLPYPTIVEQEKIAKFLDEKTAQFDSIISKKEALIEKLEEAKKSLISEVVTGKVKVVKTNDGYELVERKKEEMKDSGVEWLGDIPKEWGIKKLKHISILNPSKSEVRKYLEEDIEVSFIPMDSVRLGYINIEQSKKISEIIEGYTYFKNDDIVMAKVTPCFENRNMAISDNLVNGIGFGSTELNVIRCIKKEDIEYLYYSLQEEKFINVATSEMTGAGGLKRVPSNFLINAQFAYPNTTKEKEKIIKYLNEKEIEIKYIIDKTKQQIEKLKEAKQSLISEVVTGKIEILD